MGFLLFSKAKISSQVNFKLPNIFSVQICLWDGESYERFGDCWHFAEMCMECFMIEATEADWKIEKRHFQLGS